MASRKMARTKYKSGIVFLCMLLMHSAKPLPILRSPVLETTDTIYSTTALYQDEVNLDNESSLLVEEAVFSAAINNTIQGLENRIQSRQNIRPGQTILKYTIEITRNSSKFEGRALLEVRLTEATREDDIILNFIDLDIERVRVGVLTATNLVDTPYSIDDGLLEISPAQVASTYQVLVEYSANFRRDGIGLYLGEFDQVNYIAMNLNPTNARRVFPCMDEPSLATTITFTFNNMDYNNIILNSKLATDSQTEFRPLEGPPHLWGMVAHNFNILNIPTTNVHIYTRPMVSQDTALTSIAINNYYNALNNWTQKPYLEITSEQDGRMHIIAVPDVAKDWTALSSVCIWEPYIIMENNNAFAHRKIALVSIAEAMARQWFGYVLYPENWRHQWILTGLNTYAVYDIVNESDLSGLDESLLDMTTIFTTDVIQEALLIDAYSISRPLNINNSIFEENEIRLHINGLMKYKAAALLRMYRISLGQVDLIKSAAQALLRSRSLEAVNTQNFYEALLSVQVSQDVVEELETWVNNKGYPLVTVTQRTQGVILIQERFGFSQETHIDFVIPISYTTSVNPNFANVFGVTMMSNSEILTFNLGEEDWVIVNLQGQGYYRVNYETELWERLIEALLDPERREVIHPLNRATLIDDALNIARANKLGYDIALQVVLTMEHETEYAPWKAFVRNMDFLRKRLVPYALDDDDLDDDIYLRMVRRTIREFESEIGFSPQANIEPAMTSLTRGLVMDHACRSGYDPCIAAAVDLFYDPNNNDVVNPDIPADLRPAVYCTMVNQGDGDVLTALRNRLNVATTRYERLVILESMGCSQDADFIDSLLRATINANEPYATEERAKIFAAIANSHADNAMRALRFIIGNTNNIRNMYGGAEKLEEVIYILADNMVTADLSIDFTNWVNSLESISNLGDSDLIAGDARARVAQNLAWNNNLMQQAYEWIDENDAPTLFVSSFLISIAVFISLFNH